MVAGVEIDVLKLADGKVLPAPEVEFVACARISDRSGGVEVRMLIRMDIESR